MKEVIKKSALLGLVGVPVFMLSVTISNGIMNGIVKSINKCKKLDM